MPTKSEVLPSFYQDSVVLMQIAGQIRTRPGVRQAAVFMGTPANHALLGDAGLATQESLKARPEDLILTVDAETDAEAASALAAARELLVARRQAVERSGALRPRTLDSALRMLPGANLVAISVPGPYAKAEAMRALKRGRHVFLFSDNVPVQDEVDLKQEAWKRRLLCMGPDCGTAYLNGTGIGLYNVVPKGRIGCVAASGTGLQAVASRLAALGEGLSHGIGVGGRDLSAEVGGTMTLLALEALALDPATDAVVLISKPPHHDVMLRLDAALQRIPKPTVVCCLGATSPGQGRARWVGELDAAADAVVAAVRGQDWSPRPFSDPDDVRRRIGRLRELGPMAASGILGLFTGGTLAHEAHLILKDLLKGVIFNRRSGGEGICHRLLDLGADEYTVGRPHPMIDPQVRIDLIREAGRSPHVGVLLLDLVLGRGAHPNPAAPLVAAIQQARQTAEAGGRRLAAVASVVGTTLDPQGLSAQRTQLRDGGVEILPTNGEAARFAALIVKPDLGLSLLEARR
jgi:FdrA protein